MYRIHSMHLKRFVIIIFIKIIKPIPQPLNLSTDANQVNYHIWRAYANTKAPEPSLSMHRERGDQGLGNSQSQCHTGVEIPTLSWAGGKTQHSGKGGGLAGLALFILGGQFSKERLERANSHSSEREKKKIKKSVWGKGKSLVTFWSPNLRKLYLVNACGRLMWQTSYGSKASSRDKYNTLFLTVCMVDHICWACQNFIFL